MPSFHLFLQLLCQTFTCSHSCYAKLSPVLTTAMPSFHLFLQLICQAFTCSYSCYAKLSPVLTTDMPSFHLFSQLICQAFTCSYNWYAKPSRVLSTLLYFGLWWLLCHIFVCNGRLTGLKTPTNCNGYFAMLSTVSATLLYILVYYDYFAISSVMATLPCFHLSWILWYTAIYRGYIALCPHVVLTSALIWFLVADTN